MKHKNDIYVMRNLFAAESDRREREEEECCFEQEINALCSSGTPNICEQTNREL